jgi:hypothetical protein
MHFLETYLASVVYVALPASPGSTVLFTGIYEGLFDCADRRLYLAKSAGRNCVIGETGTDAGAPKLAWAG